MPRYDAKRIEARWQQYWDDNETFKTPDDVAGKEKMYVLDMFPYPSGNGLHVGHPEGYTATDIICRHARMLGKNVLHPMGWDAFGLPAEQYAIETGTHPRETTYKNIDNFRRQLKLLGFSYDWSREISTTDTNYVRWTQWIFLQLFDTWYDPDHSWTDSNGVARTGKGRPISELPIPDEVQADGTEAVRRYQDSNRLAYQSKAPVNWCPALGTVLANEEVTAEGLSDRGNHPVERRALRQWMLRITAYADRLGDDLDDVNWPESVKLLQRNWIGKSTGAEVDFYIGEASARDAWLAARAKSGLPKNPGDDVLRVYTTRPDTLYGATYMVIAPEHPSVDPLTTPEQKQAVEKYQHQSALKSDLDRTDLAKEKTGVFTGSYAVNPVNGENIPIWVADYVLISYGTGAIMAVPAHDERDFEFAKHPNHNLPVRCVVDPGNILILQQNIKISGQPKPELESKEQARNSILQGDVSYPSPIGVMINSGEHDGMDVAEFKAKISAELESAGLGSAAVNYRLRDWLFSRQRYWGEPFPIWHELDADGNLTGLLRPVEENDLPVELPDMDDFKPRGTPEPPLSYAPESWLFKTAEDGTKLRRETNSMPQWAGSCWYFMRFCDPKNEAAFIDPEKEKYWLPVDLYIGGVEHAVLHLLYARFWHKVLFDLGHLSCPEPFQKLVNQGMILGEMQHRVTFRIDKELADKQPEKIEESWFESENKYFHIPEDCIHYFEEDGKIYQESLTLISKENAPPIGLQGEGIDSKGNITQYVSSQDVEKQGEFFVLKNHPQIRVDSCVYKMSKSRGNVINPDDVVDQYGADSLRLYEMFMGPLEQVKPWSMAGVEGVARFLARVWRMITDERADDIQLHPAVQDVEPNEDQNRVLHRTIKAVTEDIDKLSFNTAISRMMEFTNEMGQQDPRPKSAMEDLVLLLSPFAPHLAEELWSLLGHDDTLAYAPWPQFDESKIAESEIEIPVQINGKMRGKVRVPADADQQTIQTTAESDPEVAKHFAGKTIVKRIVVPGRLVNFVVK